MILLLLRLAFANDTDLPAPASPGATDTDVGTDTDTDTDTDAAPPSPGAVYPAVIGPEWPGASTPFAPAPPAEAAPAQVDSAPGALRPDAPAPLSAQPTTSEAPPARTFAPAARPAGAAAAGPAPRPSDPPLLPILRLRGPFWALLLLVLTVASWGAARALDAPRDLLAPRGVLPWLLAFTQQILRLISVFLGLGVLAAVVPTDVAPALPFVVLGLALAVGWSARDLLPDLIAALVLAAERRIRPGQWIATDAVSGVVEQATVRVVWVRDATGRRIALPNRMMLARPVVTDRGRWPSVEVVLRVPLGHPPGRVRRILEDAVLVSPWAAPRPPEMVREEDEPGRWRVRARVLEGRFADRFEGALREHVEESLVRGAGLRG